MVGAIFVFSFCFQSRSLVSSRKEFVCIFGALDFVVAILHSLSLMANRTWFYRFNGTVAKKGAEFNCLLP